jgi:hypothetical protein
MSKLEGGLSSTKIAFQRKGVDILQCILPCFDAGLRFRIAIEAPYHHFRIALWLS